MFQFNRNYLLLTLLLFSIEMGIALFVHDSFIRPYIGDVLVVILMYCFVKSFLKVSVSKATIAVLLFAFGIEMLQYLAIVEKLGLQNNRLARTVIGTSFSWEDILAYLAGIVIVIVYERFVSNKKVLQ
jgi:glycopeptide antibiotics resistance protein